MKPSDNLIKIAEFQYCGFDLKARKTQDKICKQKGVDIFGMENLKAKKEGELFEDI